jgi:hypothetical protein
MRKLEKSLTIEKEENFPFDFCHQFNSFCDFPSLYFTEFPSMQKIKNKAFPERALGGRISFFQMLSNV